MFSWKADERLIIDDVVRETAAIGKDFFCQSCWAELRPEYKATKATEALAAVNEKTVKPKQR
ncbi:MAG: hypothetical protein Q9214_007074, partial [Letrouitia sp. 1 TL-2023]